MSTTNENAIQINNVVDVKVEPEEGKKGPMFYGPFSENAHLEWDPLNFKAFGKMARTTNKDVALALKEYYGKTFHDLRGVNLTYTPGSAAPFFVEFYFAKNYAPCPEGKIENLRDLTVLDANRNSLYYQKKLVDNKATGKHYTLNDETRLLLADIMFGGVNNKDNEPTKNKWNNYISEIFVPVNDPSYHQRAGDLLIRVAGCFDFHRILQKLYGSVMVTDTISREGRTTNYTADAFYEARFIRYVPQESSVFIMNIEQFDRSATEEFIIKENPVQRTAINGVSFF